MAAMVYARLALLRTLQREKLEKSSANCEKNKNEMRAWWSMIWRT